MKRPIIAREGWAFIIFLGVVTAVAGVVSPWLALIPGLLLALSLWFFRDPERAIPGTERDVVSPADGRVMYVREVEEPRFLQGKAVVVSIFLSIFDVHINRAPVSGMIAYREYVPGQFLAAMKESVGEVNERAYVGIDTGRFKVLVSQVAGLIARRIITWSKTGERVARGDRFGLIRFGSCTQIWLPAGSDVLVKPGDMVKGALTVIGRLPE
ncbi:MAG TPA: phosphatidylserine decarboxylase family protein [Symbiobacteriaceae bacterium]|jgi:phosphatidylserine decarboxylase